MCRAQPDAITGFEDLTADKRVSDVDRELCIHCGNCTRCPYLAIELDPANPTYYNDAGVVLHYNLQRDLDRALALYERSIELAQGRLEMGEPTDEERAQFQQYIGWAENNKRLLLELMKARKQDDAEPRTGGSH